MTIIKRVDYALRNSGNYQLADELLTHMTTVRVHFAKLTGLMDRQQKTVHQIIYLFQSKCEHKTFSRDKSNPEGIVCVDCGWLIHDMPARKFGERVVAGVHSYLGSRSNPYHFGLPMEMRSRLHKSGLMKPKEVIDDQETLRAAGNSTGESQTAAGDFPGSPDTENIGGAGQTMG